MPRRLKDSEIDTPTARRRLRPRPNPYWRRVDRTCHLGYRRNASGAGTWVARHYDGTRYVEERLAIADDVLPSDGSTVLDFTEAQERARTWFSRQRRRAAGELAEPGPVTVAKVVEQYLAWLEARGGAATAARYSAQARVVSALGKIDVNRLTAAQLRRWHIELATSPKRLRAKGWTTRAAPAPTDHEQERKRKATANRVLAIFRAALNHAYNDPELGIESDEAWRKVRPFRGVDAPKIQYLTAAQAAKLLDACSSNFRQLVHAALLTGCRYEELTRARVRDYQRDSGSLYISKSKSGRDRHVFLSSDGKALFEALTRDRRGAEVMFHRAENPGPAEQSTLAPWLKSQQQRRIKDACAAAEIDPPISFHILRHTYASHYLMNGGSIPGLAQQLGHADTRMTIRHYAHLASSWRAEEAETAVLSFAGPKDPSPAVLQIARAAR